jgi:hypothetical protein
MKITKTRAYTIEWQDEDYVKVTKHWRGFDDVAVLTGGDFETIIETIFTGAVVTRVHSPANDEVRHGAKAADLD